jgi:signal transduction histidine kinase
VVVEQIAVTEFDDQQSVLVVSTCYQDEPNGLISLQQCDRHRQWSEAEIELVRELAEQVGTAIAHATLYKELEKARKQAEAASRLKSEFLASTTHELRTPLNGIICSLMLIIDGTVDSPEEQTEFLDDAHRSALHLLDIINDILDIAKIEAGKMELELSPVRLDELMTAVEKFTRNQAQQRNLSLNIELPDIRDEVILYGNYQRLLQVLLNLVGNAIKFTHEGGVTVSAEVLKKKVRFKDQELPGLVKVRVADTGIGVSLDKQEKLFQNFSQVDGELTRRYGGTGLGLAISQKLVEMMGGVVNFYSMGEGLGSTVTFTVPLYQEPLMVSSQQTDSIDRLINASSSSSEAS